MTYNKADWFEDLYEQTRGRIYGYLARRGVPVDDIPDLTNEVFAVAWRRSDHLVATPDPLPWLLTTARNTAFTHARALQGRDQLAHRLATLSEGHGLHLAEATASSEPDHQVWIALSNLSEIDRELLLLTCWDELSPKAAAQVLQMSRGAVRVRLHRARRRFEAALRLIEGDDAVVGRPDALNTPHSRTDSPTTTVTRPTR